MRFKLKQPLLNNKKHKKNNETNVPLKLENDTSLRIKDGLFGFSLKKLKPFTVIVRVEMPKYFLELLLDVIVSI